VAAINRLFAAHVNEELGDQFEAAVADLPVEEGQDQRRMALLSRDPSRNWPTAGAMPTPRVMGRRWRLSWHFTIYHL
jgi:hypothetical protein